MMRAIHGSLLTLFVLALAFGSLTDLRADYRATGTFQYQDREQDVQGMTGIEPYLPIRLADVEVLDNSTSEVLATGYTDTTGAFSIVVVDDQTRDVVVRVLTDTEYCPFSNRIMQQFTGGWSGPPYALESAVFSNHNPTTDLDIGTVGAACDMAGKPFNIFDVQLDQMMWIQTIIGGNMNDYDLFRARWSDGVGSGSYYDGIGITMEDGDEYDDTVIGHEGGHFINDRWSRDNNPGGAHFLGDNNQDPRLSWAEGIATYYASTSREHFGLNPAPHLYVETTGLSGQGNLNFSYEIEEPPGTWFGPANEVVISCLLWDITDGTDTQDDDPGIDDDPLDLAYMETWEVFTEYLRFYGSPRTVEDFWDGWFDPSINNGFEPEMVDIFQEFQIEYYEDDLEDDGSVALANPIDFMDDPVHHTLYGVTDEDWHELDIVENASFQVRSTDLLPATYPAITVYESDGVTEIASNRNNTFEPVLFDGVGPGPYYAMIEQNSGAGIYTEYGHYNLNYDLTQAPPESAQIQLSPSAIITSAPIPASVSDTMIVFNVGGGPLHYTISDRERFGGDPSDLTWLTEDPSSGTIDAGDSAIITVTFITNDLTPDSSYDALIVVSSNDIAHPEEDLIVRLTTGSVGIGDGEDVTSSGSLPKAFAMAQNYPNPFNPSTSIGYDVPVGREDGVRVKLEVFNVRGQLIATLVDDVKTPGSYVAHWDGTDDAGRKTGSGIYIYRLKAGDFSATRKMVVLK